MSERYFEHNSYCTCTECVRKRHIKDLQGKLVTQKVEKQKVHRANCTCSECITEAKAKQYKHHISCMCTECLTKAKDQRNNRSKEEDNLITESVEENHVEKCGCWQCNDKKREITEKHVVNCTCSECITISLIPPKYYQETKRIFPSKFIISIIFSLFFLIIIAFGLKYFYGDIEKLQSDVSEYGSNLMEHMDFFNNVSFQNEDNQIDVEIKCQKAEKIQLEKKYSPQQVRQAFSDWEFRMNILGFDAIRNPSGVVEEYNSSLRSLREKFDEESCWGIKKYPYVEEVGGAIIDKWE